MSTPSLDWGGRGKTAAAVLGHFRPPVMVTAAAHVWPCWRASLRICDSVVHADLWVLSLSRWRKVGLLLELWQESLPNFKGITNGWVFLKCDW